jgi:hypothetical protein
MLMNADRDDIEFVDATVQVVISSEVVTRQVSQISSIPKGTPFSISFAMPKAGYPYVVQYANHVAGRVFPTQAPTLVDAGTKLSLPVDAGSNFTAPITGPLYVLVADRPVDDSEWSQIFDGRDPPPHNASKPS